MCYSLFTSPLTLCICIGFLYVVPQHVIRYFFRTDQHWFSISWLTARRFSTRKRTIALNIRQEHQVAASCYQSGCPWVKCVYGVAPTTLLDLCIPVESARGCGLHRMDICRCPEYGRQSHSRVLLSAGLEYGTVCQQYWWPDSPVVRASDMRLNGCEFDPGRRTIGRFVLGWMIVFGRAYHLGV